MRLDQSVLSIRPFLSAFQDRSNICAPDGKNRSGRRKDSNKYAFEIAEKRLQSGGKSNALFSFRRVLEQALVIGRGKRRPGRRVHGRACSVELEGEMRYFNCKN
jgi:hypothetical protein